VHQDVGRSQIRDQQNINPDLAVFIQNINLMRNAMAKKFTLIFSTSEFGMQLWDPELVGRTGADLPIPARTNARPNATEN
jgi:hypothetical protein